MRLEITLQRSELLWLPVAYQHLVQGFVYSLLEPVFRNLLHDEAYAIGKRIFKLFTFSRLMAEYKIFGPVITFKPPVSLIIASAKESILLELAKGIFKNQVFRIGDNNVFIQDVKVLPEPNFNKKIIIKMLSPWTMYSTITKVDGKSFRQYYEPFDPECWRLLRENLKNKYELINDKSCNCENFEIQPHRVNKKNRQIIMFNKIIDSRTVVTPITAWNGLYELTGSHEMLRIAYDTGIGTNNSMGFGCWEVYGKRN